MAEATQGVEASQHGTTLSSTQPQIPPSTAGAVDGAALADGPALTTTPLATVALTRPVLPKATTTAQHLMQAYVASLSGSSKLRGPAADRLLTMLLKVAGEPLFAAKHAAECALHSTAGAWTTASLLTMCQDHASESLVEGFKSHQRSTFAALPRPAQARAASVALLFDVDDTLAPLLQDTSYPGSLPAYPGLRPFVHRLMDACAKAGHVLRVGCLTARPGWMRWMAAAALRNALDLPESTLKQGSPAAAAAVSCTVGHAGGMSASYHASPVPAPATWSTLAEQTRCSGLATCDVLTGHLRDSLRLRTASRNTAIAATKTGNFEEFSSLHPECVIAFCGDSGQGDAITAEVMQGAALARVRPQGAPAHAGGEDAWRCYGTIGLIHDVVPLTGSSHGPKTSPEDRAALLSAGVYVFDSYLDATGALGAALGLYLDPHHHETGPVWGVGDTDAVALATQRDLPPAGSEHEAGTPLPPRPASEGGLAASGTAAAAAGVHPPPLPAPTSHTPQASTPEAVEVGATGPHPRAYLAHLHAAMPGAAEWAEAYTPLPDFNFSSSEQETLRRDELAKAEQRWCSWGDAGAYAAGWALQWREEAPGASDAAAPTS